jgi:heme/copper-type cytochrome/quinol oxidase subunit 2
MHLRRALLLLALVLGVVAVVESLVPVPRERAAEEHPPAPTAARGTGPVRTVRMRYPARRRAVPLRVADGAHVVIEVESASAGQASIPGLGLVQAVEPGTPARFDVLATHPGLYGVAFDPIDAPPARVGRVSVRAR